MKNSIKKKSWHDQCPQRVSDIYFLRYYIIARIQYRLTNTKKNIVLSALKRVSPTNHHDTYQNLNFNDAYSVHFCKKKPCTISVEGEGLCHELSWHICQNLNFNDVYSVQSDRFLKKKTLCYQVSSTNFPPWRFHSKRCAQWSHPGALSTQQAEVEQLFHLSFPMFPFPCRLSLWKARTFFCWREVD